ncbi:hypothetical protein D3C80_1427060 [compost metagenome]
MHPRRQIEHRAAADLLVVGQVAVERTDVFAADAAVIQAIVITQRHVKQVFRHVRHLFATGRQRLAAVADNVALLPGLGVSV